MLSEKNILVKALDPAADRFNADPTTDVVNLGLADSVTFLVYHAGGTTGKAALIAQACSNAAGDNAEAIPFRYRLSTAGASDERGAILEATASGIETTPAEVHLVEIEVRASELPAGKPYCRLLLDETANDPVTGCVVAILENPRYQGITPPTVLT
jgi:hypothetical protein